MSQTTLDLWPKEFGPADARLPVAVLREQAALLGSKTDNLVQADVKPAVIPNSTLGYNFYLVAPALNHYRYCLFSIAYDAANAYPVQLFRDDSEGEFVELHSERELLSKLAEVFNSDETKRVIQSLIAQSRTAD